MWERLWPGASKVERSRSPGSEEDLAGQPPGAAASAPPREAETSGQADFGGCAGLEGKGEAACDKGQEVGREQSLANPLVPPGGWPEFSDVVPSEQVQVEPEEPAAQVEAADSCVDALPRDGSDESPFRRPLLAGRRPGRRLVKPVAKPSLSPQQRLLLLDTWRRSGLPAGDFAAMVGLSKHTLYAWKKSFDREGPAGLMEKPRGGPKGSKLPDLTQRTILMLKAANPEWGCQRISDMLLRGPALPASAGAVARVLHEAGYALEEVTTRPHPDKVRHFERARPNQLWQTDLFTFVLKRQNRRIYLVAFMDDHSRFIVSYGLHASQSSALVLEVLRAGMASFGTPEEILTDNGSQYVTWRGKSQFTHELEKRGIKQIVAARRRKRWEDRTLRDVRREWSRARCLSTWAMPKADRFVHDHNCAATLRHRRPGRIGSSGRPLRR